jgi:hypothetical protein
MAFTDKQQFKIPRHVVQPGGVNVESITSNKTLTYADSTYQILTTNGALDLVLPKEKDGAVFVVRNHPDSLGELTVKNDAGSTIDSRTAGQAFILVCDGSDWHVGLK